MKKSNGSKVELAKAIQSARKALGMSQKELAERSYVSISQISRYENGIDVPGNDVAAFIANALNVDLSKHLLAIEREREIKRKRAIKIEITVGEEMIASPVVGEILEVLKRYDIG